MIDGYGFIDGEMFALYPLQGTEFMDNLARCLRYYVADRLSNDPGWRNVTVSRPRLFQGWWWRLEGETVSSLRSHSLLPSAPPPAGVLVRRQRPR